MNISLSTRSIIALGLAIALLTGAVAGGFVYITQKHNRQIALIEQKEKAAVEQDKAKAEVIYKLKEDNERLSKEQKQVETRIVEREKVVTVEVEKVMDPSQTALDVAEKAKKMLPLTKPEEVKVEGDAISFNKTDVQHMIAINIQRNWLKQDKSDLQQLLEDEKKKSQNLSYALAQEEQRRQQNESLMKEWKDAAGASKKAKVVRGLKVGGALAVTGVVFYTLGKALH